MRHSYGGHIYADSAPRLAAPEVYERFDKREPGYTKVALKPG
jgi:hypothetical protein